MQTRSHSLTDSYELLATPLFIPNSITIIENYCDKLRNRKKIYDVDIDFDEASKAWLQNKKKTGDGCYTYTS